VRVQEWEQQSGCTAVVNDDGDAIRLVRLLVLWAHGGGGGGGHVRADLSA
jgi:hypothetical protein